MRLEKLAEKTASYYQEVAYQASRLREAVRGRETTFNRIRAIQAVTGSSISKVYTTDQRLFHSLQDTKSNPIPLGRLKQRGLPPESGFGFAVVFYSRGTYATVDDRSAEYWATQEREDPEGMAKKWLLN